MPARRIAARIISITPIESGCGVAMWYASFDAP